MATKALLTLEQFDALPERDDVKRELVDGEVLELTLPKPEHNEVAGQIYFLLRVYLKANPIGKAFPSDTGFVLRHEPDTLRGPDVSFVRSERLPARPRQAHFDGAPDLAVEVVSPNDRAQDLRLKTRQYVEAGAQEVWIVDPEAKEIDIYARDRAMRTIGVKDKRESAVLPGFSIAVTEIFDA